MKKKDQLFFTEVAHSCTISGGGVVLDPFQNQDHQIGIAENNPTHNNFLPLRKINEKVSRNFQEKYENPDDKNIYINDFIGGGLIREINNLLLLIIVLKCLNKNSNTCGS